jgi:outer membrane lipoprotein carrier protein
MILSWRRSGIDARRYLLAAALAAGIWPALCIAQNATPLDRYLTGLATWQAEFSQHTRDAKGRLQPANSEGLLAVMRPGRFRWELRSPGPGPVAYSQLLIADGRNLWFFDRDLEQVTVRPARDALTTAPAALLAGAPGWRDQFVVRNLPKSAGLDWMEVRPRKSSAEFRDARLGFAGLELRRMLLKDSLGQTSEIEFRNARRNPPLAAAMFEFAPPAGVDVIGVPVPARP